MVIKFFTKQSNYVNLMNVLYTQDEYNTSYFEMFSNEIGTRTLVRLRIFLINLIKCMDFVFAWMSCKFAFNALKKYTNAVINNINYFCSFGDRLSTWTLKVKKKKFYCRKINIYRFTIYLHSYVKIQENKNILCCTNNKKMYKPKS